MSYAINAWWALIPESLEVFTLGIVWVTAILYMRHVGPRHRVTYSQSVFIYLHFCFGE